MVSSLGKGYILGCNRRCHKIINATPAREQVSSGDMGLIHFFIELVARAAIKLPI
jgi:hypothetical protein